MKKAVSVIMLAALLVSLIFTTSCRYREIEEIFNIPEGEMYSRQSSDGRILTTAPDYSYRDYSKKPYFMTKYSGFVIYNSSYYYMNSGGGQICYLSLIELEKDMRTFVRNDINEYAGLEFQYVCPVKEHDHELGNMCALDCPGYYGEWSGFLLDAYESAGSFPIIYTFGCYYGDSSERCPEGMNGKFVLYRYDTGTNTRKVLTSFKNEPYEMMAYGDSLYIIEKIGESYELYVVEKATGNQKKMTPDFFSGTPDLVCADEDRIYISNIDDGRLYKMKPGSNEAELVFTQPTVMRLGYNDVTLGIRIHNGYLYYRDNFRTTQFLFPQYAEPVGLIEYDIMRVPMGNTASEPSLVAEGVFENCDFGIAGNALYFAPFDTAGKNPGEKDDDYYFNFTNGRLCAVDLETLVCRDVVSGSGLYFGGNENNNDFVTERYFVGPIGQCGDNIYDLIFYDLTSYISLYDFETGALYFIYAANHGKVIKA